MFTVEEYIREGVLWSDLPEKIRTLLKLDQSEYHARVLVYFLQNQLEYSGELIKKVMPSERTYYCRLVEYSCDQLMLFPYHLQRKIVPGLNLTPFEYYRNIIRQTMLAELSYDRIPNFTAADCYQLLGIGRNEYIDLLNSYRGMLCSPQLHLTDSSFSYLNELLPKVPLNFTHFQPWFIVRAGCITVDDVNAQTPEIQSILDEIIDNDIPSDIDQRGPGVRLSAIPVTAFQELYKRGLVYVEVPILETDCLYVPTLDGFIMNRVTGDSCETLLYKIFVSLDPQSCIRQLAADLGVELQFVINAASIFVRLGFARKADSGSESREDNVSLLSEVRSNSDMECGKIAFVFDSSIIAYFMLGNLSTDLKKHSVTMFEVGKLTGNSLKAFYNEISSLPNSAEQDVIIYYEHAKSLIQTMRQICGSQTPDENDFRRLDLVRFGSLNALEPITRSRILSKNYNLLVCMAPLSHDESQVLSPDWPLILGPPIPEVCSPWFRLFATHTAGNGSMPSLLLCRGTRVTTLPPAISRFSRYLVISWGHEPVLMDIYTLFYNINDLTANYPVFIQAYDDRESCFPLYQHFLPLPLSSDFIGRVSDKLAWLGRLSKGMDLTSLVGYLSLLLPDGKTPADVDMPHSASEFPDEVPGGANIYQENYSQFLENSVVDKHVVLKEEMLETIVGDGRPIRLLSVHLGIPLFNSTLNDLVFEKVRQPDDELSSNLLSPQMRSKLAAANDELRKNLVDFINSAGGVYVHNALFMSPDDILTTGGVKGMSAPELPLPSKSLCCTCDGELEEWEN